MHQVVESRGRSVSGDNKKADERRMPPMVNVESFLSNATLQYSCLPFHGKNSRNNKRMPQIKGASESVRAAGSEQAAERMLRFEPAAFVARERPFAVVESAESQPRGRRGDMVPILFLARRASWQERFFCPGGLIPVESGTRAGDESVGALATRALHLRLTKLVGASTLACATAQKAFNPCLQGPPPTPRTPI